IDKRPVQAIEHLRKYDKLSQELLICLLPLAVELAEVEKINPKQMEMTVEQLHMLLDPLQCRAPLVIEKICFCSRIDAFGVFEKLPLDHVFQPGELVRAYAELRNFTSERHDAADGQSIYVTRLAGAVEIRDNDGKSVWKQDLCREPDPSQTP